MGKVFDRMVAVGRTKATCDPRLYCLSNFQKLCVDTPGRRLGGGGRRGKGKWEEPPKGLPKTKFSA